MHTVTFTCPQCKNLMAVGGDHLGQQVRCPTCQNVVVAPLRDSDSAAQDSSPTVVINLVSPPPQESHESIFGETQDEDLFGTRPPKIEIPTEPAVTSAGSSVVQLADYPPLSGLTQPPVARAAAQEPSPEVETAPAAPPEEPWYVSATPAPPPPEPALPQWTDQPVPAEPTREPDWMNAPADHEDQVEPLRLSPPRQMIERRKGSNLMLSILAPYAVAMTIIAIWYFWKYQNYESSHHPLEMMGDVGRVDLPRKKDGPQTFKLPAPDLPLPDHLKVQLGAGSLTVGDLEITPLRIEQGRFKFHSVLKSGLDETRTTGKEGLILYLRLRNKSSQWAFCPTDPLFERSFDPQHHDRNSKPYTLIEVGQQLFFGGPLDQQNLGALKRMYVDGQDHDEEPLNPGEERVTVVCSNPMNDAVIPAVTGSKDVMTWRVHLRRGVTRFHGFDYSVTAVIGVQFTAGDIKKLAQN